jgi:hypothetical protein
MRDCPNCFYRGKGDNQAPCRDCYHGMSLWKPEVETVSHEKYKNIGSISDRLVEECAELIKAVQKAKRFGLGSCNPYDDEEKSNGQAILDEIEDVQRMIDLARDSLCKGDGSGFDLCQEQGSSSSLDGFIYTAHPYSDACHCNACRKFSAYKQGLFGESCGTYKYEGYQGQGT